jgi:hypothetical protein
MVIGNVVFSGISYPPAVSLRVMIVKEGRLS